MTVDAGFVKGKPRYTVDPCTPQAAALESCPYSAAFPLGDGQQPNSAYIPDVGALQLSRIRTYWTVFVSSLWFDLQELPAASTPNLSSCYCTRMVHTSLNTRVKSKVNVVSFAPTKSRVISGSEAGVLTYWFSTTFNRDTEVQV